MTIEENIREASFCVCVRIHLSPSSVTSDKLYADFCDGGDGNQTHIRIYHDNLD